MPYTEGAFLIAFSTMIIPAFDVVRVVLVRIREGHSLSSRTRTYPS